MVFWWHLDTSILIWIESICWSVNYIEVSGYLIVGLIMLLFVMVMSCLLMLVDIILLANFLFFLELGYMVRFYFILVWRYDLDT